MGHRLELCTQEHPNEWRSWCTCGWTENAQTKVLVMARHEKHVRETDRPKR
jgi:hypothetical protein